MSLGRPQVGPVDVRKRSVLSKEFIDSGQTFAKSSTTSRAHGLGEKPKLVSISIVCQTDDNSFVAGDTIDLTAGESYAGLQGGGWSVETDSTVVKIHWGSNLHLIRQDTFSDASQITPANWLVVIAAWA